MQGLLSAAAPKAARETIGDCLRQGEVVMGQASRPGRLDAEDAEHCTVADQRDGDLRDHAVTPGVAGYVVRIAADVRHEFGDAGTGHASRDARAPVQPLGRGPIPALGGQPQVGSVAQVQRQEAVAHQRLHLLQHCVPRRRHRPLIREEASHGFDRTHGIVPATGLGDVDTGRDHLTDGA